MMLKLLKLFIDIRKCLNSLIKDEWLSFIKISSEENNDLSEIINIVLQTINQQEIFHQRMFFLLIKEIVIIDKVIHVLLQNFMKIYMSIFCLKRIVAIMMQLVSSICKNENNIKIINSILTY